jgi:4,5-dihydroxyphthalate decarboxylase
VRDEQAHALGRALLDGRVQIDGVDPVYMTLVPEEMFFRAMRTQDFDVSELSLSSYAVATARGDCPYIAVPVFLSRAFRHTAIYVRKDRVKRPEDLKGRRVGLPEYQLSANVWARAILHDDHGVAPQDVRWVRGGIETPGRPEKIPLALPPGVSIENAPAGVTISEMLDRGEIDGFMHVVGVRKTLAARHPWLPVAVFKAFSQAKALALEALSDTSATKVTLPFVEEQLKAARETLGEDFWSYGVPANRTTLDTFLRHHHAQGLSVRRLSVDEMFHPSTYETYAI